MLYPAELRAQKEFEGAEEFEGFEGFEEFEEFEVRRTMNQNPWNLGTLEPS